MRRLTDISMGSVSTLLPVYPYYSVLVSDTFLVDATYRLSDTFLVDAIGVGMKNNNQKKINLKCILQMKNTPHFTRKVPHFSVKKLLSTNHNFPLPNYRYK